ncbi:MAG: SDR family oxidoreductase [Acidobacteriota bacterium]|nr:SDR family oxidoreductase [Acidobacteriota bacterium]
MQDRWASGPSRGSDAIDQLVYLSNTVGREERLVQPGGGNTSVKMKRKSEDGKEELVLAVKGSGTDLRTIPREGFTQLSMARLAGLRERGDMSDEEMMSFMRACMLHDGRDPVPSVETPLHSVLPHRVIAHTHDVATMSLTNVADETAEDLVKTLFGGKVVYVPYVRPGFPLARSVMEAAAKIPDDAVGMALAHHGLVAWADDVEECYARLVSLVSEVERFVDEKRGNRRVFGPPRVAAPPAQQRAEHARFLMPVVRGELGATDRAVLRWDDSESVLDALAGKRFAALSQKGMTTPEHILRAGRLPVWVDLDLTASRDELAARTRDQIRAAREEYLAYHARNAGHGDRPLDDWAKVVLVPGVGMLTAFKDKKSAATAAACYRAVIASIEGAESIDAFRFIPEADVFAFERWPLERRKVEEAIERERKEKLLPRHIALVLGGGSGIGEASARRFAEEGAHVVVGDLDGERASAVAAGIGPRAVGAAVDVRDEASLASIVGRAVLEFGGLDTLFYTVGASPRFAPIKEIEREDLEAQVAVHYVGAVLAIREAARVMERQGLGGSIICSVSKAALAPGRDAVAYAGSKAALQQALRVAALELGPLGIRVNAINADQIDTPLFRRFVEARAAAAGRGFEEQLEVYRRRNALGVSMIPAEAVAELAVLLASERFRYTTGDILTIDGGLGDAFPR